MSTITMTLTQSIPQPFSRHSDYDQPRDALPPIRQAIPALSIPLAAQDTRGPRSDSSATSPATLAGSALPTPDYAHSPSYSRRRRASNDDIDERATQVPRLYSSTSPHHSMPPRTLASPPRLSSNGHGYSSEPQSFHPRVVREAANPPRPSRDEGHYQPQPSLPRLPSMDSSFDRRFSRGHGRSGEDGYDGYGRHPRDDGYVRHSRDDGHGGRSRDDGYGGHSRPGGGHYNEMFRFSAAPPPEPPYYRSEPYGYQHPTRSQSLSVGSVPMYNRDPFPPSYGHPYPNHSMRFDDMGRGDSRKGKRRGNLPKETTEKLAAWFMSHLNHPYPTEEEKQMLMQDTGLQMNQISNWFINARRRRLPKIHKDAEAENNAKGRQPPVPGPVQLHGQLLASQAASDGEASVCSDDGFDGYPGHQAGRLSRGSV